LKAKNSDSTIVEPNKVIDVMKNKPVTTEEPLKMLEAE